ncbi:hypothetical protein SEVIR_9G556151v4 [Setaria viridis]
MHPFLHHKCEILRNINGRGLEPELHLVVQQCLMKRGMKSIISVVKHITQRHLRRCQQGVKVKGKKIGHHLRLREREPTREDRKCSVPTVCIRIPSPWRTLSLPLSLCSLLMKSHPQ